METIEEVLKESISIIRSIVGGRFHGEYIGYRLDPIPFIIIRVGDSLLEVPITHTAFKAILEKAYRVLEDYERRRLLAYEASGIFKIQPYQAQLLILRPVSPHAGVPNHQSSLVGTSPHPRGVTSQCPRGWVLGHPPSQYSTQVSGQYSLKVPAYKFFAYF